MKKVVAAIGVFDGVHLGHRKVIEAAVAISRQIRGRSVVVTFDPHPADIYGPKKRKPLLVSPEHRLRLIENIGVDTSLVISFTRAFARLSPDRFIRQFLAAKMALHTIVVGEDYRFGRGAKGTVADLEDIGRRLGFRVRSVKKLVKDNLPISSSRIRALISGGLLKEAAALLGRRVEVLGTVIKGSRIGRRLGYPTANIDPHHEVIPPPGVYAVVAHIGRRRYPGVVNIGRRPTVAPALEPTVELHILKYKGRLYGRTISIGFLERMRGEVKFRDMEGLVRQIKRDERRGLRIFTKYAEYGKL